MCSKRFTSSKKMERMVMDKMVAIEQSFPGKRHFATYGSFVDWGICNATQARHIADCLQANGYICIKHDPMTKQEEIYLTPSGKSYFEADKEKRNQAAHSWFRSAVEDTKFLVSTSIAVIELIYIVVTSGLQ